VKGGRPGRRCRRCAGYWFGASGCRQRLGL